jgi:hypothetical protein
MNCGGCWLKTSAGPVTAAIRWYCHDPAVGHDKVGCLVHPGPRAATASMTVRDPNVWSGRAVQEVFGDPAVRSRINVSGLCLERALRAIMDISAHAI